MNRRKDNYSDGPKYKKDQTRNYSFKEVNSTSFDRFGYKNRDKQRNVRIIQKNLIHVIGLPQSLSVEDIASQQYFGKYGSVEKYSLSPITNKGMKSKVYSYNAYVTYVSEVEASLAIIALDGKTIGDRLLKVSYGTTKYCSFFAKSCDCPNIKECLYLHEWQPQNEIVMDEENPKIIYREQFKMSVRIVKENIDGILKLKMKSNSVSDFPSIEETISSLVELKLIEEKLLNQKLEELTPHQLQKMSHRKSVSSISTSFSGPKYELHPQEKPEKSEKVNTLISKFLIRNMILKTPFITSRLVVLQGEEDPRALEKLKYYLCKQLIFQTEINS